MNQGFSVHSFLPMGGESCKNSMSQEIKFSYLDGLGTKSIRASALFTNGMVISHCPFSGYLTRTFTLFESVESIVA